MNMLKACVLGGNMGLLASPPKSYALFFPSIKSKRKFEDDPDPTPAKKPSKEKDNRFLANTGEKKLPPHTRGLPPCQLLFLPWHIPQRLLNS